MIVAESGCSTRPPLIPGRAFVFACFLLLAGLVPPVTFGPDARADSAWVSSAPDDFNGTGSWFSNTELDLAGGGIRLVRNPDWISKNAGPGPSARAFGSMAAVDGEGSTVLFGGTDWSSVMGDTWTYDLNDNKWHQKAPPSSPPERAVFAMATIYGDDRTVLFGGTESIWWWDTFLNDTWVYDLGEDQWYERRPAVHPSARYGHAMAGIDGTDKVVLFGGNCDAYSYTLSDETWVYDAGDDTWTLMAPTNFPIARYFHQMATIAGDDKVLLFGGYNNWQDMGDTWVYDLGDNQWYELFPSPHPAAQSSHVMATVYNDDKVLLFSGSGRDTWTYDAGDGTWTACYPQHRPSTRGGALMATVSGTNRTVLFGGDSNGVQSDTWHFDPVAYASSGEYRSPYHDAGGPSNFLLICWSASVPPDTSVDLQLRTANTSWNLEWTNFTGPDGTSFSYYTSESVIWFVDPGDRFVQYKARLRTSNQSATPALNEVTIRFNRFPEIPQPLEPAEGAWVNTTQPLFRWRFNDTDTAVQGLFEWQLTGTPDFSQVFLKSGDINSNETSYVPEKPVPEGTWYWRVRTADSDGWGPFCEGRKLGVDLTAPRQFAPEANPARWTFGAVDIFFQAEDDLSGVDHYTVYIDGKSRGVRSSPYALPELPDGNHSVVVRAHDMAGNYIEGKVRAYTDRTAPAPFSPTAEPPSWTRSSPQIIFYSKDNASGVERYEVSLDGGTFTVRTSPCVLTGLDDGPHEVTVRAFDRAGNCRDGTVNVYIDQSAPDPLGVTVDPPGWTNRDPTFTFYTTDGTSDIDHYELKVDGGPFTACTSPFSPKGLPDGMHTITVRAFDLAGNFVEKEALAFTDRTPPDPFTPVAEPAGWTSSSPVISFATGDELSEVLRYEARTDGGPFTRAASPWTAEGLSDGEHLIVIRATDQSGNSALGNVTVLIDRSPPGPSSLRINNGAGTTGSGRVRLAVGASDSLSGVGQMCFSNDGVLYSAWEPYAPERNWTLSGGPGDKTVYFRVRDNAGNEARAGSAAISYSPPAEKNAAIPVISGGLVAAGILFVIGAALYRRKKRRSGKGAMGLKPTATAGGR